MANTNINQILLDAEQAVLIGEWEQALKLYEKILEIDPDNLQASIGIADIAEKKKLEDEIFDIVKEANEFFKNKKYNSASNLYKKAYNFCGKYGVLKHQDEIGQRLQNAQDLQKEYHHILGNTKKAAAYFKKGEKKAALSMLNKLLGEIARDERFLVFKENI